MLPRLRLATAALAAVVTAATPVEAASVAETSARQVASGRTAQSVLAEMGLRQKVGQLFMVGTPATSASPETLRAISRYHVGNVMLTGRSQGGTRTPARVAAAMQARATTSATDRVRLFVATDQEGGQVQVLHGAGISEMPAALEQGRWGAARLRDAAGRWARQLRNAGVNMNLAPVLDTVPSPSAARSNPPVGAYQREFGYTVKRVAIHGRAFANAMSANGVAPTVKHFPGLGRVRANTDTSSGVTDFVTRRHDPYLAAFKSSIEAGVPFVMMSTAYDAKLDPANPAAFSPFVIRTVLRGDLGFRGVVISDDLGKAKQVSRWSYGTRASKLLRAGGDMVLTVNPNALPAMYRAVLHRAQNDPGFRRTVDRAALRVLQAKEQHHLL